VTGIGRSSRRVLSRHLRTSSARGRCSARRPVPTWHRTHGWLTRPRCRFPNWSLGKRRPPGPPGGSLRCFSTGRRVASNRTPGPWRCARRSQGAICCSCSTASERRSQGGWVILTPRISYNTRPLIWSHSPRRLMEDEHGTSPSAMTCCQSRVRLSWPSRRIQPRRSRGCWSPPPKSGRQGIWIASSPPLLIASHS